MENTEIKAYNKKQRLTIYMLALELLKTDIENPICAIGGICYYVKEAVISLRRDNPDWINTPRITFNDNDEGLITYPELMKHKPDEDDLYDIAFWFDRHKSDGGIKRVQILEDVICSMQKKTKKVVTFKIIFTYK